MSERKRLQSGLWLAALAFVIIVAPAEPVFAQGACPAIHAPVCARKKTELVNYANDCLAARDGAKILARGVCPQGCPMIYKPVCAEDSQGVRRNYGNACAAEKDGAKVIRNRRCWVTFGRR